MRHQLRVLKARTLAWIGFVGLVLSIARGRVDEVWVGDSNAVFFGADKFPKLGVGSTEPRRWVWHLGPRLMFSVARDGYPPMMHRMLRVLRRIRANRDVLWIFSAGEIDLRCHLVPRLKAGADITYVKTYIERVQGMVRELDVPYAAVSMPVPASDGLIHNPGFPVVGTVDERSAAHRLMRERILSETGPASDSNGPVIYAFDAVDQLSDEHGHYRPDLTSDGIHPNDAGRAVIRTAMAEFRATVLAGAKG
jgi:lysophospholipase L1-like esterase